MEGTIKPKVGEVWLVDIQNAVGHQQRGKRPFIVTSNNKHNNFSPAIKGITVTKQIHKKSPVHVPLPRSQYSFLNYDSIANCEEVSNVDKSQFIRKLGDLDDKKMAEIAIARVQDEPFLYEAFLNGVQDTKEFNIFRLYS